MGSSGKQSSRKGREVLEREVPGSKVPGREFPGREGKFREVPGSSEKFRDGKFREWMFQVWKGSSGKFREGKCQEGNFREVPRKPIDTEAKLRKAIAKPIFLKRLNVSSYDLENMFHEVMKFSGINLQKSLALSQDTEQLTNATAKKGKDKKLSDDKINSLSHFIADWQDFCGGFGIGLHSLIEILRSVKHIHETNICEEASENISSNFQFLLDETNNEEVIMEIYYRLPNENNDDIELLLEELRDTSESTSHVFMSFNLPEINWECLETKDYRSRGSQCPGLEDHDHENYQLPLGPEVFWDQLLQLGPYKSVGPHGNGTRILKEVADVTVNDF
ncbi:hypothetical protein TURU_014748 [Turdus rufiventris]|nr:hypothetical protein TURU_014748 [Turdus rufiventris]